MAAALKCDRCGKFYEAYGNGKKENGVKTRIKGAKFGAGGIDYDLCQGCMNEFLEFMGESTYEDGEAEGTEE